MSKNRSASNLPQRTGDKDGKTHRVVGGDPDDAEVRESREADSAGSVRDKVEEGTDRRDHEVTAVCRNAVRDGAHAVLADTVALQGSNMSAS